jgi:hypothetical protein
MNDDGFTSSLWETPESDGGADESTAADFDSAQSAGNETPDAAPELEGAPTDLGNEADWEEIEADIAEISSSAVMRVSAEEAAIASSAVGLVTAQGDVTMQAAAAAVIIASGDVTLDKGGANAVIAGHDIAIERGVGSTFIAGNDIRINQGGGGLFVASKIKVKRGFVGVLLAREATVSEDSRVILDRTSAAWFGGLLGAVLVLGFGVLFGARRRRA